MRTTQFPLVIAVLVYDEYLVESELFNHAHTKHTLCAPIVQVQVIHNNNNARGWLESELNIHALSYRLGAMSYVIITGRTHNNRAYVSDLRENSRTGQNAW